MAFLSSPLSRLSMPLLCERMSASMFPHHTECVLSLHRSSFETSPTRRPINIDLWLWSRRHRHCHRIRRYHCNISLLPHQRGKKRTTQICDSLYLDLNGRVMISICSCPFLNGNIWNDGHQVLLSNHADSHDWQAV